MTTVTEQIDELRIKGNECMNSANYSGAVLHYTHALKLNENCYPLYSNRSLAFLKMKEYHQAMQDATETIRRNPDWPKGYFRKAEVEFQVGKYKDALEDYAVCLTLQPEDKQKLIECMRLARKMVETEFKKDYQIPWVGAASGFCVGVAIVLKDHFTTRPSMVYPFSKVLFALLIAAIGFAIAKGVRYYENLQVNNRLQPRIVDEEIVKVEANEAVPDQTTKLHRHGNKASARQRYRKGKL